MKTILLSAISNTLFWMSSFLLLATPSLSAEFRIWTNHDGRKIEAKLVFEKEGVVSLKLRNGNSFDVQTSLLSDGDQKFVAEWKQKEEELRKLESKPKIDNTDQAWPRRASFEENFKIEIVKENRRKDEFIYRSPHFEFQSDVKLSRTLVRDFAEIFEATFAAIAALPLSLSPSPPEDGYYKVQLFKSRNDYLNNGGMTGSGGVYLPDKQLILVPLSSLGVTKSSSGVKGGGNKDTTTLAHEVTHQVMHPWLRKFKPWFFEGIAVYLEHIPYKNGQYRFEKIDIAEVHNKARRHNISFPKVQKFLNMTHQEWNLTFLRNPSALKSQYHSAFLFVYYFFHLDGEGDAAAIKQYIKEIGAGVSEEEAQKILLGERTFPKLKKEIYRAYERKNVELF